MYDMYPYHFETEEDAAPFSERGMSGLGHPEYFPVTVSPRVKYAAEVAVELEAQAASHEEYQDASR